MSNKIVLRKFEISDIERIKEIYVHYVKNSAVTFEIKVPSKEMLIKKFEAKLEKNHPVIIALIDEQVVGFAYASTFRPRAAYRFTCENAIYIDKNFAGRGIGSLLLAKLLKQAKDYGFNQMIAIITKDTKPSIALHKKFGFKVLGEFPELGYKFEKWHDIIHMQRKL